METNRFKGQVAIVTGGANGIGFGTASQLGAEGARVIIVDSNQADGEQAAARLGAMGIDARLIVGDVGDPETAKRAVSSAVTAWGRIDVLVNNAGAGGQQGNIWEVPIETLDLTYRTNLRAPFLLCREVIPRMMKRDYGRIVNVASIAGKEGNPKRAAYSSTKAGLIGLTKSVGKELASTGIRVNCVTPGVILTRPVQQLEPDEVKYMVERIPMGRAGTVEETVAMVAWLASEECSFTTGAVFDVSGGRATY